MKSCTYVFNDYIYIYIWYEKIKSLKYYIDIFLYMLF
jgi:hypothetical protein